MWLKVKYYIIPPVFVTFFTCIVHYLSITGRGDHFTWRKIPKLMLGNSMSWVWAFITFLWAFLSLKISSEVVLGPETSYGYRPSYKGNSFEYYCFTVFTFHLVQAIHPGLSETLFDNFPEILGTFSSIALILCGVLLVKGYFYPSYSEDTTEKHPILYEFYRGVELHPSVFGVDIKQLTNCRIGLMGWQIFILAFFYTSLYRNGFNAGFGANVLLQSIYISKFFWWEAGYFYTLDMMLDRAGYYICWGCLVWVPCLYTYSSYYIVNHQSSLTANGAWIVFILGTVCIFLNYRVDYEKQIFRKSPGYICQLWGKKASFIKVEYKDQKGRNKESALLTSGFWGVARHMNYTFEIIASFFWCIAGSFENCPMIMYYFIFLFILLVHRVIRDEQKCREKYGKYWDLYCSKVRYRLLPLVW